MRDELDILDIVKARLSALCFGAELIQIKTDRARMNTRPNRSARTRIRMRVGVDEFLFDGVRTARTASIGIACLNFGQGTDWRPQLG